MVADKERRQGNLDYNGDNRREQVNIGLLSGIVGNKPVQLGSVGVLLILALDFLDDRHLMASEDYATTQELTAVVSQMSDVQTSVDTLSAGMNRAWKHGVAQDIRHTNSSIILLKLIPEGQRTPYQVQALLVQEAHLEEYKFMLKDLNNESSN